MSTFEAALRGGAVALLAFLALASLRGWRRSPAARYSALLAASAAAYAIASAPDEVHQHAAWLAPLRLLSIGTPAVFWLWASACFDDEFQPSWGKFVPWVGSARSASLADGCSFGRRLRRSRCCSLASPSGRRSPGGLATWSRHGAVFGSSWQSAPGSISRRSRSPS
jgi:hypothetical protein